MRRVGNVNFSLKLSYELSPPTKCIANWRHRE